MNSKTARIALAVLAHVALVAAWYLFVRIGDVPKFVMPGPIPTINALLQPNYAWWTNVAVTGTEIFGGYFLALVIGVALALAFTWSKTLEAFFMPLLVSLNMVPKVALGPLIIVWFKYGVLPNSIMAFSIAVFPILLTTARGLREIEPELLDLVRSLKGSRWQLFTKIQLPGALPYIFSGMKIAIVLAVTVVVVSEFVGSNDGLGYLILRATANHDLSLSFAALFVAAFIGLALSFAIRLIERLTLP